MCLQPLAKRSSNEVLLSRINTLLLQRSGLYVQKNFCSGTYINWGGAPDGRCQDIFLSGGIKKGLKNDNFKYSIKTVELGSGFTQE